jgi:hypothetical protein
VWPHLVRRDGGSIVNVGSIAGIRSKEFMPQNVYGSAKGDVIDLGAVDCPLIASVLLELRVALQVARCLV